MIRRSIRRHPLSSYFILAYAISWIGVLPLVLSSQGILHVRVPPLWHGVGALGPTIAAVVVTRVVAGSAGLANLRRRLRRWRVGVGWILLSVLSPLALFGLAFLLVRLRSGFWPPMEALWASASSVAWLADVAVAAVAYGFGEEVGWRGFALPRLQEGRSALAGTVILAVFWGLWHVPFFFYRFSFGGAPTVVGFFIGILAGAIWLTFLHNSTRGSILMVALWHMVWNVVNLAGLALSARVVGVMSGLVIVLAGVVVLAGGPTTLSVHGKYVLTRRGRYPV